MGLGVVVHGLTKSTAACTLHSRFLPEGKLKNSSLRLPSRVSHIKVRHLARFHPAPTLTSWPGHLALGWGGFWLVRGSASVH